MSVFVILGAALIIAALLWWAKRWNEPECDCAECHDTAWLETQEPGGGWS